MSTELKNRNRMSPVPDAEGMRFAVIVAEWNKEITSKLLDGALKTLKKAHCQKEDIIVKWVPGALELPLAAKMCLENLEIDGIVAIGCVIKGGTPHFDYVCKEVFDGLMKIQIEEVVPITFGILTTENLQQALDRAGGKLGNKGAEAAEAVIKMSDLQYSLEDEGEEDFSIPESFNVDEEKMS